MKLEILKIFLFVCLLKDYEATKGMKAICGVRRWKKNRV